MSATYFVSHGCAAALSCCRDDASVRPERGAVVVIRSARGQELGTVLNTAVDASAPFSPGELLRLATPEDQTLHAALRRRGQNLLDDAHRLIEEQQLPLLPLDVDLTLDGGEAIIQVLRWAPCTLTSLLEELQRRHGCVVRLLDTSRTEEPAHACGSCGSGGCGEGGCGSGGGGCASGDCSRGSAFSADDLTRKFAELRRQMESRVPLV